MLTVVTITRNDVAGLKRTCASVLGQKDVEVEWIVIDAASDDGTREYLGSLAGDVSYVSEKDRGRYDGMNKGAALATGEWLCFMHSSDCFATDYSAKALLAAVEAENADWGYGLSRIWRGGRAIGLGGQISFDATSFLLGRSIIPHQASVVRRRVFLEQGGYSDDFGLADDQRFFVRLMSISAPTVIPEIVCDFDGNGVGSTRPAWKHFRDMARARQEEKTTVLGSVFVDWTATALLAAGSTFRNIVSGWVGR